MSGPRRCVLRFRSVYQQEYAAIADGVQPFLVFRPGEGTADAGDVVILNEIDEEIGGKTGRAMKADVTHVQRIDGTIVVAALKPRAAKIVIRSPATRGDE